MNLPAFVYVFRCMVRDTFRASLASRAFWLLLGLSGLTILLCLSVGIDGATARRPAGEIELFGADRQPYTGLNRGEGHLTLGFGAIHLRLFRDGPAAVAFLQSLLARWCAGSVGMLLVLLWTASFLPGFLHPRAASVLLAKPVPRWALLAGKYLGVVAFVALQAVVFVGGTWAALGLRTGCWAPAYLWAAPLLVFEFAVLYSAAVLLAVWTRRTVLCLVGSLLFWALCTTVNFRHLADEGATPSSPAAEAAYWVLPKPTDVVLLLGAVLESDRHFPEAPELERAVRSDRYDPGLSLLSSLAFTAAAVGLAGRRLGRLEY
jgi:hypothetical protein